MRVEGRWDATKPFGLNPDPKSQLIEDKVDHYAENVPLLARHIQSEIVEHIRFGYYILSKLCEYTIAAMYDFEKCHLHLRQPPMSLMLYMKEQLEFVNGDCKEKPEWLYDVENEHRGEAKDASSDTMAKGLTSKATLWHAVDANYAMRSYRWTLRARQSLEDASTKGWGQSSWSIKCLLEHL